MICTSGVVFVSGEGGIGVVSAIAWIVIVPGSSADLDGRSCACNWTKEIQITNLELWKSVKTAAYDIQTE